VTTTITPAQFRRTHGIDPDSTVIGLLPGSRRKEVVALLPDFLAAAERLTRTLPGRCVFLLPQAPTISTELLAASGLDSYRQRLDIRVLTEHRYDLMAACDAAVAASGTVTLELAILDVPTVAAYRVSPRTYRLGRLLVKLPWFSLVNLIAGREVIPELLQDQVTPGALAGHLGRLLQEGERVRVREGLAEVRGRLGRPGTAGRAADIALEIMHGHGR
jgi:lipid-A-disaccharide synthase